MGVLKPDGYECESPHCSCLKTPGPTAAAAAATAAAAAAIAAAAAAVAAAAELGPPCFLCSTSPLVSSTKGVLFISSICAVM